MGQRHRRLRWMTDCNIRSSILKATMLVSSETHSLLGAVGMETHRQPGLSSFSVIPPPPPPNGWTLKPNAASVCTEFTWYSVPSEIFRHFVISLCRLVPLPYNQRSNWLGFLRSCQWQRNVRWGSGFGSFHMCFRLARWVIAAVITENKIVSVQRQA